MNMQNTIKQLKKLRTDAIYGKKKHYNAASRKREHNRNIVIAQILISATTGTSPVSYTHLDVYKRQIHSSLGYMPLKEYRLTNLR